MSINGKLDKAWDEGEIDNENQHKDDDSRQIQGLWDDGNLTPSEGYGASSAEDAVPLDIFVEDE